MEKNKKAPEMQGKEAQKNNVIEIGNHLPAVIIPALTLPQTIKTVEELFRKIQHRDRLELYSEKLSDFVIKKTDEDLEPSNYYTGCRLEIKDDENNVFSIKHPLVIKETIDFMRGRFTARLKEIEAQIKLPTNQAA